MEYKMKKSMALGVVIMLCAVAMIGAGYAAFNGHARTYNEGNSANAGFIELVPGGTGDAQWTPLSNNVATAFSEYTYNDGGTKKAYYIAAGDVDSDTPVAPIANYVVKVLGSKTYTVANKTSEAITAIDFGVKSDKGVGNTDFVYVVKVANGASIQYVVLNTSAATAENVLSFTGLSVAAETGTTTFTVSLCIAYLPNVYIPDSFIGPAVTPTDDDHDQGAKQSTTGPVDIGTGDDALALGFSVTDATTPASP
ncbi:hypothetical protein O8W32_00630 [Methanomassiliicoccales archaeon LGM-DZ1]|nr:hypothetical protein O8W32_00630 [Methanomassiliicoccales archaeon LGM-DZ1]